MAILLLCLELADHVFSDGLNIQGTRYRHLGRSM